MQDQEVADALVLELRLRVVGLLELRSEIPARQQLHEPEDPGLAEEYGGGLERLEETAGEPAGHDGLVPEVFALVGGQPGRLSPVGERASHPDLYQEMPRLVRHE